MTENVMVAEPTSRFTPGLPAPLARQEQRPDPRPDPRQDPRQNRPTLRADAQRNRARILDAAESVFAELGASASTEEVASRAGVAIGTVFRHFPTKRDLLAEIMKGLREQLIEQVRALADHDEGGNGLYEFFVGVVEQAMVRRTVVELLAQCCRPAADDDQGMALREAVDVLLVLAQHAGTVRRDVRIDDVMALLVAASQGALRAGWDRRLRERTVHIIFDGLRAGLPAGGQDGPAD
jgi:AcrR family transcriptional regulator